VEQAPGLAPAWAAEKAPVLALAQESAVPEAGVLASEPARALVSVLALAQASA
jgi:hypothetical protein